MVKDPRAPQGAHRIVPVNTPAPVEVECGAAGLPAKISVFAKPMGTKNEMKVAAVQARWRIDDEWWRETPISRLYYTLLMEDGRLITLFHDLVTGHWFQQRY